MKLGSEWKWKIPTLPSSIEGKEKPKVDKKFGYIVNGQCSCFCIKYLRSTAAVLEQLKPLFGLYTSGSYLLPGVKEGVVSSIIVMPFGSIPIDLFYVTRLDAPLPGYTPEERLSIYNDYLKLSVYRNVLRLYFKAKTENYYICRGEEGSVRLLAFHSKFVGKGNQRFNSLPLAVVEDIPKAYALLGLHTSEDTERLANEIEKVVKKVDRDVINEVCDVLLQLNRRI